MTSNYKLPQNLLASDTGHIRKEGCFSTISVAQVSSERRYLKTLKLHSDIMMGNQSSKKTPDTIALVDVQSGEHIKIPSGAIIEQFTVKKHKNATLDSKLKIMLGYFSPSINIMEPARYFGSRICNGDNLLTADILNVCQVVKFDEKLTNNKLKEVEDIYNLQLDHDSKPKIAINYDILKENSYAGEIIPVIPAITVTDGDLLTNQLVFEIEYVLTH